MFRTASIKITAVFVAIAMTISGIFSVTAYISAESKANFFFFELLPEQRENIPGNQRLLDSESFTGILQDEYETTISRTLVTLLFLNLMILIAVSAISYLSSRKVLGELEKLYIARSQFARYVSHSLRTPLANMLLDTEVTLSEKDTPNEELKDLLTRNLDEINRLKSLSKSLMRLSALDPSGLEFEDTNLSEIVESTVERYDRDHKRIKIHTPSKPLIVHVNESGIDEAVAILINNAMVYSFQETEINVRIKKDGKRATFSISSKGNYIPPDKLKNIFDPFYRAENAYGGEGAGLGLALAKQIIDLHNGKISVYSHENNKTEFIIELPLKK